MQSMLVSLKNRIIGWDYVEFFRSILWALVIAIAFRTFLFEPFRIPSGSMIPTLQVGDYLFTSKFSYGFSKYSFPFGLGGFEGRIFSRMPQRGDIIVFKGVKDPDTFYIKRLVGLPGDDIQVRHGLVYINNEPLKRHEVGKAARMNAAGQEVNFIAYQEVMSEERKYTTLTVTGRGYGNFPDDTPVYKVPEGYFFFMGDNRNNSIDSRYLDEIGYIPFDHLVGRADFLLWTSDFSLMDLLQHFDTNRAFSWIK